MTAVYATVHTIDNFQINIWRVLFKCMDGYAKSVASSFLPRPASLIAGQERLWRQRAPCSSSTSCQRKKSSNAQDFEPLRRIAFNRTKFDGRRMAERRRKWSSLTRTSSRKINCWKSCCLLEENYFKTGGTLSFLQMFFLFAPPSISTDE